MIFAGLLAPPKSNPQEIAIETMNHILGGEFTSRINMNLREDKHWSYGAGTFIAAARGQRPFILYAPVQTDKTRESITEAHQEYQGITGDKPVTAEELAKSQKSMTLQLNGAWETVDSVQESIQEIVGFGLPDDYYQSYPAKVLGLQLADVSQAAQTVVQPGRLLWVVVGDRTKVEGPLRELGLGEIRLIDTDGQPLP